MSKSAGQWVGTIAGGVIGSFFGMTALGASLGGMVGGMIDPPKGPSVTGPRLDDQSFTSSTLGAALARGYGTFPVSGNVIWIEGDKYREVTTTESQGGKGGGGSEVTSYTYYATFAVSLLRVTDPTQTVSLRRLWVGSNLVFDAGSDNLESIIASNTGEGVNFTFYNGSDTQQPNPRWQADKGVNAVSGFPGRCYIVIEDLDLTKYGNSLAMAQIKAEVSISTAPQDIDFVGELSGTWSPGKQLTSVYFKNIGELDYSTLEYSTWDGNITGTAAYTKYLAVNEAQISAEDLSPLGLQNPFRLYISHADRAVSVTLTGFNYFDGTWKTKTKIHVFDQGETLGTLDYIAYDLLSYANHTAAIDGSSLFIFSKGYPIVKLSGAEFLAKSASSYNINKGGLSENYFFGVLDTGYPQTSTTVYKISRDTLTLVDTYTENVPGTWASIYAVSDTEFYTASNGSVYRWVNGQIVETIGSAVGFDSGDQLPTRTWFFVGPSQVIVSILTPPSSAPEVYLSHPVVNAEMASLRQIVTAECGLAGIPDTDLDLSLLTDHDVRGDRITERGSGRSALEPLQARFPFDVAHSGYKLRFVSRGNASLATIPETDLGTVADSEKGAVLLTVAREMDTQLPRKVSVKYLDVDREYDLGEQYSERPAPNSVNERVVELPLVMNSSEGAQTADVLLSKEWVERTDFGPFTLPPTWRALEAADVVTIEHRGQAHTVRLTRVEYLPDGRITCNAKLTSAQSYTSTATGEAPAVLGQSLVPLRGVTTGLLLDIPMVLSQQDKPGISAAVYGLASGWPGALILRSDDSGNSYQGVFSSTVSPRVFRATTALGAGRTDIIDATNVLTLTEVSRAPTLASVSFASAAAGQNLAALGADGRWEIVSFLSVTDNGNDTWTIRDFMRGRFGTEWAMSLHQADDLLVMLSPSSVGFIGLPLSIINSPRPYRAVTFGASIDSAADIYSTYQAVNLKPLSPIRLSGSRDPVSLDWTITATRRSRTPVEPFSGLSTPIGEASEVYDLEIWSSDYSTLKRTFSGLTSASASYTAAQQVADFGGEQTTLYTKWYPLSSSVGRGYPLVSSVSRYLPLDPFIGSLVLGMHMDDALLSDVKGNTTTLINGIARSATQSKFGGYSASFNGSNQAIALADSSNWTITGDFTIDAWVYVSSLSSNRVIISHWYAGNASLCSFIFRISTAGRLVFAHSGGDITGSSLTVSINTWTHVAVTRSGSTIRLFVGGGLDATTATVSGSLNNCPDRLGIGCESVDRSTGGWFSGYIDDLRFTKACRWTSAFTPPTTSFPDPE